MEKRQFFQGSKRDEHLANESPGATIFKKQKIMIRPVMNLPKQNDAIKDSAQATDVYDPFQLTNEELDKRVDDVYDPFEPTLSDNEVDLSLDEVKSPEIEEPSFFKKVETLESKNSPPDSSLYDFDIEQLLDSKYNESNKAQKADNSHHKLLNTSKTSKKLSSDFDIFAEEELEKAQAAAELPTEEPVCHTDSISKASTRFDKLSHKIKSAFSAESDPTEVTNRDKLTAIDNTVASNTDTALETEKPQSTELIRSPNVAAAADTHSQISQADLNKKNVIDTSEDFGDAQNNIFNQDFERIKDSNDAHSTKQQKSHSRSPSVNSLKHDTPEHADQSKQSTSRKSSQSPSPKKRKSHSRERKYSEISSSRKKRSYRRRSKSHSRTPEKAATKSRRSRSRSRHRNSRRKHDRSPSRSRKDSRTRKRSRSRSKGRRSHGKYRSRSHSSHGRDKKRKRSRSKQKSPSTKKDYSRSRSPRKSAKKLKKSRSRSRERESKYRSDHKISSKRSSSKSKSKDAVAKQPKTSEDAAMPLDSDKPNKRVERRTSKERDHKLHEKNDESAPKKEKKNRQAETLEENDAKKLSKERDRKISEENEESDVLKKSRVRKQSDKFEDVATLLSSEERHHTLEESDRKKSSKERDRKRSEKHEESNRRKYSRDEKCKSPEKHKYAKLKHSKKKEPQLDEKQEKGDKKHAKKDRKASETDLNDEQSGFKIHKRDSDKRHKVEKRKHSKDEVYDDSDKKHDKGKSSKYHDKGHREDDKSAEEKTLIVKDKTRKLKDDQPQSSKDHLKYSDDEDETLQKSSKKKKKKKKYEKDYDDIEEEVFSNKKKKKHKKYDTMSSGSETKSVKKQKLETRDDSIYYDSDHISKKKKKKKRYTSSDKDSDADSNTHREGKSHKQSKKHKQDKKHSDLEDVDSDKAKSSERKHSKKKHKKDLEEVQVNTYEDEVTTKKKKKKARESKDTVDIYADLEEKNVELPTYLNQSSENDSAVVQSKEIDTESISGIKVTENTLEEQKVNESVTTDNDSLMDMHLLHSDKPSDAPETSNLEKEHRKPKVTNEKETLADTSQDLDIDYLLEESLKNVPSAEESASKPNSRRASEQMDDKALRSPSPMSPSLLSPASSHPEDAIGSQNSSMIMSSQDFKETPSYAETFLEQSRKRWEKSYRNKSPHISATMTPDESSVSEVGKRETQTTKPDIGELSSLSDISVDPAAKIKLSSSEYTTAVETSSVSAEDIFRESPQRGVKHDNEQTVHNVSFKSEIELSLTEAIEPAAIIEAASENVLSSLDKLSQDTDLRVLLEQIKTKSEPAETGKDDARPTLDSEQPKQDKDDAIADKTTKKRKRSASPKRRSSSPPHRRHSERKRSERHRRSRSRERRSRYRRSSSRSPRRKRSYESHRRRDSNRDSRRNSDRNRSPERRRYSSEKTKRSQPPPETAVSETAAQVAAQPASELLNKFLEQTNAFIPLLQQQQQQLQLGVEKPPETNVPTSPQPIATISGISSAVFPLGIAHDVAHNVTDELCHPHDIAPNTFPNLVNESRPALIQIPTIDSHTSELDTKKQETIVKKDEPDKPEDDLYSPSCPMSPLSLDEKEDETPPPPTKVTSSSEVSSTTPSTAASLFSKLFGIKKDNDNTKPTVKPEITKEKEPENVLNPTQILNIAGLNPQQQSAAKDAIMSIAELSKQLQLGGILSHVDKPKPTETIPEGNKEEDGLSPVDIDDIESSAVALYNRDKRAVQQKKKEFQDQVVAAAKQAIKPHYERREVNKEQYKDIMKRAVNKICQTDRNMEVNEVKIRRLIRRYVECYQQKNEKKREKIKLTTKQGKEAIEESEIFESPPSPETSPLDLPYSPIDESDPIGVPSLLKKEPRKIVTLPDLPLPPPPPPPRPKYMM